MQDTPEIVENFGVSLSNLLFTTPATLLLPAYVIRESGIGRVMLMDKPVVSVILLLPVES